MLFHALVGWVLNRGWAVLLPLVAVVVAIPLGYPSANKGEPLPIWLGLLFFVPLWVGCAAVGIGLRRLRESRSR